MRLFLLCPTVCCALLYSAANAQSSDDSRTIYNHYHYYAVTLFSGANVVFPYAMGGVINVSFPYTSTDASTGKTTRNIFQSKTQKVTYPVKPYYDIAGIEFGGIKQFFSSNVSVELTTGNGNISAGYGFIWYFNGLHEHEKDFADARFVFKASMNIAYTIEAGDNGRGVLGYIDNSGKTINVLGLTARPEYTVEDDDGDGTETDVTYRAKDLKVSYSQNELSLLPRISIGNNPYRGGRLIRTHDYAAEVRGKVTWELSLGYNIPVYDRGGIKFLQDNNKGNDDSKNLHGSPVSLKTQGLTFLYNGRQTTSTPFHFSGLYISFAVRFGRSKRYY